MAKNPLHPPSGCTVHWIRREPYSLTELREWLPAKLPKPVRTTGVGRNCDLFSHCVKLAHQPKWAHIIAAEGHAGQWLDHVRRLNFAEYAEDPLPDSECKSIAKSCAKYSLRNYSDEKFSEIQSKRGSRRAQQRWHPSDADYSYQDRDTHDRDDDRARLQPSRPRPDLRDLGAHRPARPDDQPTTGQVESRSVLRPDIAITG